MKRILFVFSIFAYFLSIAASAQTTGSLLNKGELPISQRNISIYNSIDTSLKRLEIYDPASIQNYFGLGFPGAATHSIFFPRKKPINSAPLFNSFSPHLFTTHFESNFNFKKPQTQIEYVIFPSIKTEQYLDLFHVRNISKNWNVGIKVRKIKSNGYYLHQGSNITNILAFSDFTSKNSRYHLYTNAVYNSLVSIENGGLVNDSINYSSRGVSLQSLPVNLTDAKNRISAFGGKIIQGYDFGKANTVQIDSSTTASKFTPSSRLGLSLAYSNQATTYIDNTPLGGFYENIYKDSGSTNDKFRFNSIISELSYSTLEQKANGISRMVLSSIGISNEASSLERSDRIKTFTNSSAFASVSSASKMNYRFGVNATYYVQGYNKNNYDANVLIGYKFLDSTKYAFNLDFIGSFQERAQEYNFQNYYSNHFRWKNNFGAGREQSAAIQFSSKNIFNVSLQYSNLDRYVFLDSNSLPAQMSDKLSFFSGNFEKLLKLGSFYINARIDYQKVISGTDIFGLPKLFTRNSIYWSRLVFKKAMDLQIGFDIMYCSKYYGLAYQPALASFYYQKTKQIGGYPALDFFINFKIRQARVFFKVDHLNYGLSGGQYAFTPNYLLPGRTFRFGLSWLFSN